MDVLHTHLPAPPTKPFSQHTQKIKTSVLTLYSTRAARVRVAVKWRPAAEVSAQLSKQKTPNFCKEQHWPYKEFVFLHQIPMTLRN